MQLLNKQNFTRISSNSGKGSIESRRLSPGAIFWPIFRYHSKARDVWTILTKQNDFQKKIFMILCGIWENSAGFRKLYFTGL